MAVLKPLQPVALKHFCDITCFNSKKGQPEAIFQVHCIFKVDILSDIRYWLLGKQARHCTIFGIIKLGAQLIHIVVAINIIEYGVGKGPTLFRLGDVQYGANLHIHCKQRWKCESLGRLLIS